MKKKQPQPKKNQRTEAKTLKLTILGLRRQLAELHAFTQSQADQLKEEDLARKARQTRPSASWTVKIGLEWVTLVYGELSVNITRLALVQLCEFLKTNQYLLCSTGKSCP